VTDGAAYGAALLAGVGVGVFPTVEAACEQTIKIATETEPNRENRALYDSLYGTYRSLYPTLRPTFERLAP
jgi:xylulokinase